MKKEISNQVLVVIAVLAIASFFMAIQKRKGNANVAPDRQSAEVDDKAMADSILAVNIANSLADADSFFSRLQDGILVDESLPSYYVEIVNDFYRHSGTIKGLVADEDSSTALKAKSIEKVAKRQAIKVFPVIRKSWAKASDKMLWEKDIDVRSFGAGNTVLEFVGGRFAANSNIKEFQVGLDDIVQKMKFKQVRYKWYDGDDEYTYYTIDPKPDGDLEY